MLITGQFKYMKQNGFEVITISADGKEVNDIKVSENVKHIVVPFTRQITPLQDVKCLWQLYKILKKEQPQIVHTHTPKAGLIGMMAAKLANVPIRIHTVAGMPLMKFNGVKRRILEWCEALTYFCSTEVWPNASTLKNFIIKNDYCHTNKLHIIGKGSSNGIDLTRFSDTSINAEQMLTIKQGINFDANCFYLLAVGRLVFDKGIEELVAVFEKLYATNNNLRLLLVGDFEQHLDPLSLETQLQIKNHQAIFHIAWSDKVEYYMAACNLFVHASHREGFPNVLLQAGAMSCPIVCSDIDGNIDIIKHQKTGLIFRVKNKEDLFEKIKFAIENTHELSQYSKTLRAEITANYNREHIHQQILSRYQQLFQQTNL
jgi:glycosyltransferase involved in cell wall biosynthesis